MATVKKKLLIVLSCVAMLFAGIALLSACGGKSDDLKVTFMVQEDDGAWGEFTKLDVVDGQIALPSAPIKEYYTFTNWYKNEDFSGDPFTGKDVKTTMTVYARFIPVEVDIYINGKDEGTQNLIDVVNGSYDPGENLEFDGWYTNADYAESSKWNGKDTVNTLYARSVARITFNDGYQDVFSATVTPNTVYADPTTSGVQTANIQQSYMSKYDISYRDEDGNEFDFSEPITKNTTITVKWRSPFLIYSENPSTRHLSVTMNLGDSYDDTQTSATKSDVPVISVLSQITFDKDGDGVAEKYTVDEVCFQTDVLSSSVLQKVIVGDGIKVIQNFVSTSVSSVKEIVLPDSLRVIQNCFNNLDSLPGITIPNGVEVILGSFWAHTTATYTRMPDILNIGECYTFEIAIPDSVKNLSAVPYNLTFSATKETAKQGDFYKEDNRIYKIDDAAAHKGALLLIADFNGTNGDLSVPNGVNGIQVGAFFNRDIKYLRLPESFEYIGYNAAVGDYPEYTFANSVSPYSAFSDCLLWDARYTDNLAGNICPLGYAIFNRMDNLEYLVFYGQQPNGAAANYAFIGDPNRYASMSESMYETYTAESYKDKVILAGESNAPKVNITVVDPLSNSKYTAVLSKSKNETLTIAELLDALDESNGTLFGELYQNGTAVIEKITNLGAAYDLSTPLVRDSYLSVTVKYHTDGGYAYKDNGDGTAVITGFNAGTAKKAADGLYIIGIPSKIGTLEVVGISKNAFANATNIGYVFIPSSVKTIAEKAFYMCESLVLVDITPGGLETIGARAFEGTSLKTITLPLACLKEVGAYAFKIETLEAFIPVSGEEDRQMTAKSDLQTGEFFIKYETTEAGSVVGVGLYRYVSKTESDGVTFWDTEYIASASAYYKTTRVALHLGDISDKSNIVRYEVMEGAFYHIKSGTRAYLYFDCVSRIHTNAFTDCDTDAFGYFYYSSTYMQTAISGRKTLKDLVNDKNCAEKFDSGWFVGYTDEGMGKNRITVNNG